VVWCFSTGYVFTAWYFVTRKDSLSVPFHILTLLTAGDRIHDMLNKVITVDSFFCNQHQLKDKYKENFLYYNHSVHWNRKTQWTWYIPF
jgi:intergrase/recombinase